MRDELIKMGHFYKEISSMKVHRAVLCTFCNGRHVTNYHKCLFHGIGEVRDSEHRYVGCTGITGLVEITEEEYTRIKVAQMMEEL